MTVKILRAPLGIDLTYIITRTPTILMILSGAGWLAELEEGRVRREPRYLTVREEVGVKN